ncbi:MAG: hypothetical protein PHU75_07865 [Candidatus Nanopelagicales bacterium]|nr:hypothetical protein [Candidatus Nanopelagicales bacterium]
MKVQRVIASTAAGLALVASVPLIATVATADNNGNGRGHGRDSSSSSQRVTVKVALTPVQVTSISAARKAYLTTVNSVNTTLHATLEQVQADVLSATNAQRLALIIAQDAYSFASDSGVDTTAVKAALDQAQAAYQSAAAAAKTAAQAKSSAASATAKAGLDKARVDYQAAVTAVFPSGTAISSDLLNPPKTKFGWMHENESWHSLVKTEGLHLGFALGSHR